MNDRKIFEVIYSDMLDGVYDDEFYDGDFKTFIGASMRKLKGACKEYEVNFHDFIRFVHKTEGKND